MTDRINISAEKTSDTDSVHGDTMPAEAASANHRKDFEQVAKRRFQAPTPKRLGNFWYIRVRQDVIDGGVMTRKLVRLKLAPSTTPEREVRKIAAETMRPENQGLVSIGSAVNFNEFVDSTY